MARYTSLDFIRFLLQEVHDLTSVLALPHFSHLTYDEAWMMIESAKQLADRDMAPFLKEMDEQPARYMGDGTIKTHPQLKTIIRNSAEQGWIAGVASLEHGGLQLPMMIHNSAQHIFVAANNGSQGYGSLTTGSAALITSFGTPEQIETFVPKMFAGEWQGTMALTEPQAGSSLTDVATRATPLDNGFYSIKGQKIFISGGQHEACENFIHLTLARMEGAPAGVKGISLFIIPKFWPEKDGTLTPNDVFCAGDFQKMGQRGYCTTHLVFGDADTCKGWLVGEPHKGITYMFQMMNEARIGVGMSAAAVAQAAYYASLQYAHERPQGRLASEKDPLKPPTLIINHPDVQRMLLTQKAIVEGSLALGMECNRLADIAHAASGEEKQKSWLLLELLTPIMKTYPSEQGSRAAALAIQTLGGYGFTTDFPVQQFYRDLKIMSLYEGTTGIQSIDLLGRKVTMEKGRALMLLSEAITDSITKAYEIEILKPQAQALQKEVERVVQVLTHLKTYAQLDDVDRYLSDATVFMEQLSYVVIGWQWLKMATVAQEQLRSENFKLQTQSFYEGKVHTMKFFFRNELPHAAACAKTLMDDDYLTSIEKLEILD
jgi:alkylation response protein AidB-like acyl-CoA dehydrogenase